MVFNLCPALNVVIHWHGTIGILERTGFFVEYVAFTTIYLMVVPILLIPNLMTLGLVLIIGIKWVKSDMMNDVVILVPLAYSLVMSLLAYNLGYIR